MEVSYLLQRSLGKASGRIAMHKKLSFPDSKHHSSSAHKSLQIPSTPQIQVQNHTSITSATSPSAKAQASQQTAAQRQQMKSLEALKTSKQPPEILPQRHSYRQQQSHNYSQSFHQPFTLPPQPQSVFNGLLRIYRGTPLCHRINQEQQSRPSYL